MPLRPAAAKRPVLAITIAPPFPPPAVGVGVLEALSVAELGAAVEDEAAGEEDAAEDGVVDAAVEDAVEDAGVEEAEPELAEEEEPPPLPALAMTPPPTD